MVGVAVKVTLVPAQIAPDGRASILTLAGKLGLTIIVIAFDITGLPVAQERLEVITQVITSSLARAADV